MNILICNDDGVFSPGLEVLAAVLGQYFNIYVMAPETQYSGASSALSLNRPLHVRQLPTGFYAVNGTPADSAFLALNGYFEQSFDLLVSGINCGANLADDIIYSGTVGAAREGRFLPYPAIAISLVGQTASDYIAQAFVPAANWLASFIKSDDYLALKEQYCRLLNINIPLSNFKQEACWTMLGKRQPAQKILPVVDPRGHTVFWVGNAGMLYTDSVRTECIDYQVVQRGLASITPLHLDCEDEQLVRIMNQS